MDRKTFDESKSEIKKTEKSISTMLGDLTGNKFDLKGLSELKALLNGDKND